MAPGSVVVDSAGARPTIDRAAPAHQRDREVSDGVTITLPEHALLASSDISEHYSRLDWTTNRTGDNSGGNGLVVPCQRSRYAAPRGVAALVRVFESSRAKKQRRQTLTQLAEAAPSEAASQRAYRTAVRWFAGCDAPRMQLLSTRAPRDVGDEAVLLTLRSWQRPVGTVVVGVARTGRYVTATVLQAPGDQAPGRGSASALLAEAVGGLCILPEAGACAPRSPATPRRPAIPTGTAPAMLGEIDLPPVPGVKRPWVGTRPRRAMTNDAASGCDATSFSGRFRKRPFRHTATRTFVVPEAGLSREFGLTETVGALPGAVAAALVGRVRRQLSTCEERDLTTSVVEVRSSDDGPRNLSVWRLDVQVTDSREITFWMAFLRDGDAVGQLGFVPDGSRDIGEAGFVAVAERALERLGSLRDFRD